MHLQRTLAGLDTEPGVLAQEVKVRAVQRAEIEALKHTSEKQTPAESGTRQKMRVLQETAETGVLTAELERRLPVL